MNSEICLTCLGKPSKIYNLDEIILENLQIRDLIQHIIPSLLEKQEFSLPDIICEKCKEELVVSFNFQKKCLNSLQNLRTMWTQNALNNETFKDDNIGYYSNNDNSISFQSENDLMDSNAISIESLITNNDKNVLPEEMDQEDHNGKSEKSLKDKEHGNNKSLPEKSPTQIAEKSSTVSNQCKICSRHFKQPQGLASHMSKTHFKKHLYQCQECSKGFNDEELFIKHCNRHLGIKPFPCSHCEKSFESNSLLNKHKLCHSKELSYQCEICDKKFYRNDVFKLHKRRHEDEKLFQCLKCDITFERFSDHVKHLEKHKKESHHKIENTHEQLFSCNQCDEEFDCIENLKTHKKGHTINMPYQCQECSKSFSKTSDLQKHTRHEHKDKNRQSENVSRNEQELLEMPVDVILTQVKSEKMDEDDDDESALEDKNDFSTKRKKQEIW